MKIQKVTIHHIKMPLQFTFATSFGVMTEKEFLIIEATANDGTIGYGECVAFAAPWYTEETIQTCWHMLEDFLLPLLQDQEINHPDELQAIFAPIRLNHMAKSAIEGAIWDIYAQQQGMSLAQALGATQNEIRVGVAIGLQPTKQALLQQVGKAIAMGYGRIKVKIKPGHDIEVISTIREHFPDVPLMADANAAYTLDDMARLQALDAYNLLMIEQPLAFDDLIEHATLQRQLQTAICLDESIHSLEDVKKAIQIGSCRIINIKIGRVGGLTVAKQIHDYCRQHDVGVWCGGMLETGIGRLHNIALNALPHFVLPGDLSGSHHYWQRDIVKPPIMMAHGKIQVPMDKETYPVIDHQALAQYTLTKKEYDVTGLV